MTRLLAPTRSIEWAVGPLSDCCVGYNYPGTGSVAVLKLSSAVASRNTDRAFEESFLRSRAMSSDAYVGQVNPIEESSVSWLNGLVWGYDIARHDQLTDRSLKPIMRRQRRDGFQIPVYSASPLLEAGEALFGTAEARRFPLVPWSHTTCVDVMAGGPVEVWSAIALAIAEDR